MISRGVNDDKVPLLYELDWRANVNVFTIEIGGVVKRVILYDDHRTLLNVLYFARMKGILTQEPNLIYFDYHDDACCVRGEKLDDIKKLPISEENYQVFWQFVEFYLGTMDDDWLWTGMELDLIKNAIRVGGEQDDNIQDLNEAFNPNGKYLYPISHLDFELSDRGCFGDHFSSHPEEDMHIRSIFGCCRKEDEDSEEETPYVLDFDLDCFTGEIEDTILAWPEAIFYKRYCSKDSIWGFLQKTMQKAAFITICREPKCCGGLGEANKILSYLDKYFFDGQLHTMSIE